MAPPNRSWASIAGRPAPPPKTEAEQQSMSRPIVLKRKPLLAQPIDVKAEGDISAQEPWQSQQSQRKDSGIGNCDRPAETAAGCEDRCAFPVLKECSAINDSPKSSPVTPISPGQPQEDTKESCGDITTAEDPTPSEPSHQQPTPQARSSKRIQRQKLDLGEQLFGMSMAESPVPRGQRPRSNALCSTGLYTGVGRGQFWPQSGEGS